MARWLIHDLRNPAQTLSLLTELMGGEPEAGDADAVETIRQATAQLARSLELLDRLVRLPRPTDEQGPVSLVDALDFVAAVHHRHRSGARLNLDGVVGGALPPVSGVDQEIEQILLNLVLNALEATGDGASTKVTVRAVAHGDSVRVSVSDNGPGVAPERRVQLFEPTPEIREGRLRGLGLAVSRGLARRAGGNLVLSADHAPGAQFDLLLPAWRGG